MGIFDAINIAESAMSVHRVRSEVAAENVANVHTPGYRRQEVDLRANRFSNVLDDARSSTTGGGSMGSAGNDASDGAVQITGIRQVDTGPYSERQNKFLATTDMMRAKSAFELNVRAATMLKSMALSSLEIGRGS